MRRLNESGVDHFRRHPNRRADLIDERIAAFDVRCIFPVNASPIVWNRRRNEIERDSAIDKPEANLGCRNRLWNRRLISRELFSGTQPAACSVCLARNGDTEQCREFRSMVWERIEESTLFRVFGDVLAAKD